MKIEEINKLSDTDLGKRLAELCGIDLPINYVSLLCQSKTAISEIEKIVVEKGLSDKYNSLLATTIKKVSESYLEIATMPARDKAEILLSLLEEKE